jgi:subtilisin family serine protease
MDKNIRVIKQIPGMGNVLYELKDKLCQINGFNTHYLDMMSLSFEVENFSIKDRKNKSQETIIRVLNSKIKTIEILGSEDSFMITFKGKKKKDFLLGTFLRKNEDQCDFSEIEIFYAPNEREDLLRILVLSPAGEIISQQYDYTAPKTLKEIYSHNPVRLLRDINLDRVLVGIVDSGIDYNHPELADKIERRFSVDEEDKLLQNLQAAGSHEEIKKFRNSLINGINTSEKELAPYDNDGIHYDLYTPLMSTHGTQVAHVLVDKTEGEISILPGRIPPGFSGNRGGFSEAIDDLVLRGAKVINLSLGWNWHQRFLVPKAKDTIKKHSNVLFVVAAGNDGKFANGYPVKFNLPNVIVVGSSDSTGMLDSYSNFGRNVDVAALGTYRLFITGGTDKKEYIFGTSFSAPAVARLAALMLYQKPQLRPFELKEIICASVDIREDMAEKVRCKGNINESKALDSVRNL